MFQPQFLKQTNRDESFQTVKHKSRLSPQFAATPKPGVAAGG